MIEAKIQGEATRQNKKTRNHKTYKKEDKIDQSQNTREATWENTINNNKPGQEVTEERRQQE